MTDYSEQESWSRCMAHVFVTDITRATEFYESIGFSVDFLHGKPPFYGELVRDKVRLAIRLVCEPVYVADVRSRQELLSATVVLPSPEGINDQYRLCAGAGIPFHRHVADQEWNT